MTGIACLTCGWHEDLDGHLREAVRAARAHRCPGRPYPLRVPAPPVQLPPAAPQRRSHERLAEPGTLPFDALVEDIDWLTAHGNTADDICARLGIKRDTLMHRYARHDRQLPASFAAVQA